MIPFIFDVHLPNRTLVRSVRVLASDEPTARAKIQRMYPTGVLKTHKGQTHESVETQTKNVADATVNTESTC